MEQVKNTLYKMLESQLVSGMILPVIAGINSDCAVVSFDLAKISTLLIGGDRFTGVGTYVSTLITGILKTQSPETVRLMLIDTKYVTFSVFDEISDIFVSLRGTLNNIVTDIKEAIDSLYSINDEQKHRICIFREAGCDNILDYNTLYPEKALPRIVCIVYDYYDLFMYSARFVSVISQIARNNSGLGVHVIIVTEQPVKCMREFLDENLFSVKICFRTIRKSESIVILGIPGAETLSGKGEMLFKLDGNIQCLQGPYISIGDVEAFCHTLQQEISCVRPYILPYTCVDWGKEKDIDPLFQQAAEFAIHEGSFTTADLQRKFWIGYNRAGRLIDQLINAMVISPMTYGRGYAVIEEHMDEL